MARWLLAALAATVVMYLWGFVFWAVNPLGDLIMRPLPREDAVLAALAESNLASGTYYFPAPASGMEMDAAFVEKHRQGPLGMLHIRKEGAEPMAPSVFIGGGVHYFIGALIAGYLLMGVMGSLGGYGQRAAFVTMLGIFAGFTTHFSDVIWLLHPLSYHVASFVAIFVQWLLAGLVMAAIIRPEGASPQ